MNNISFGYHSPVKRVANMCAYTNEKFTDNHPATFEHIKLKSQGGKGDISNCLAVNMDANMKRAREDFKQWLRHHPQIITNIQNYLNDLRGLKIGKKDYVQEVSKILNKQCGGIVTFYGDKCRGNKLNVNA